MIDESDVLSAARTAKWVVGMVVSLVLGFIMHWAIS